MTAPTWGFGLCFLHMRNVQGHTWNHKRVHRIYCELELNLRIKPRRRQLRPFRWTTDMAPTISNRCTTNIPDSSC